MSQKGILEDVLGPAWSVLTAEQRICWHFTAAENPSIEEDGTFFTKNGWQWFVDLNAPLAVVNADHVIKDAPHQHTQPKTDPLLAVSWPLPGKLGTGGSAQQIPVLVAWGSPGPTGTDVIVTQGYDTFRGYTNAQPLSERISGVSTTGQSWITTGTTGEYLTTGRSVAQRGKQPKKNKSPAVRHVSIWQQGDPDLFVLNIPVGYYATTAGHNKFALIKGKTARRRPDLPLAKVRFISRETGQRLRKTIPNPAGGTPTNISRPRHYP